MSTTTNGVVAGEMHAHHRAMRAELEHLVNALAATESDVAPARDAVVHWCRTDLLPHAAAEEAALYPAAAAKPALAALVTAMIREHRDIGAHVDRLATEGLASASMVAAQILALFSSHLEKEELDILPVLVADPDTDLQHLLEGMHELLGAH